MSKKRRFPLLFARDVMQASVAELMAENAVAPRVIKRRARDMLIALHKLVCCFVIDGTN